jgi:small multidrug resistance pump
MEKTYMAYLFLAIAIAGELVGTVLLKFADGFTRFWPSFGSILAYSICFLFFSKCLQNINLSIAYSTWSAIGILVSTIISVIIFKQGITFLGIIGLALIVIGVAILNFFGTVPTA